MKFLIVLALFAAIAFALPVEEIGQNQEIVEAPVALVDLEAETSDDEESDFARSKRHFGFGYPRGFGYGGYPGGYYGGYNRYPGYGYGGYGGYGHHHYGHRHHGYWGK